jgi:phosphate uptake regulator
MAESEFRKLQITGGSTMIVSLPREWVSQNRLAKGDIVSIEELSSGDLRISPMHGGEFKRSVTIDCCQISDGLTDVLIGSYLAGADIIRVVCSQPISRVVRTTIREFLRDTRGMEIESEQEREICIVSLLNPSELQLQVSINRMYVLISGLIMDGFAVFGGEDKDLLKDIDDRERQIDARRLLIERQVASALKTPAIEKRLAVDRFSAMEHANIARALERMGDHATRFATLIRDNQDQIQLSSEALPMSTVPAIIKEFKALVHNMYTKDLDVIHLAKTNLQNLIQEIEHNENDVWSGVKTTHVLYCVFQISESLRRLCAYGVNFSESLLNMLMHERLESV